ncbi:MAG: ribosome maturation factor RimM [Tissierellia bacterium]|nr:ribosome maturation factor RimM [Tissierellia bacterium]
MNNNFTEIGKIVNTHGIKGTLKVYPYTDDLRRFLDLNRVFVGSDKTPYYLDSVAIRNNMVYINFRDYNSINDVLHLKDSFLYILKEERVPLQEGQYFISDLIDLEVYDEDDKYLGVIIDLQQGPGNDVYIIKDHDLTWLLPGVKEFILSINLKEKKMIVRLIEGMRP